MSMDDLRRRLRALVPSKTSGDDGVDLLARALTGDSDRELDCETCKALFPEYVRAQALGQETAKSFAAVRAHLLLCPDCERDYIDQIEIAWQLAQDSLPRTHARPAFDPRLVGAIPASAPSVSVAPSPQAWWTLLRPVLSGLKALFVSFTAQGTFAPTMALEDQGFELDTEQGVERRRLVEAPIPQVEGGTLAIAAVRSQGDETCSLIVRVDAPGWKPAGRNVRLFYGRGVWEIRTDTLGRARFDDVPVAALPELQIELPDLAG